MSCDFEERRAQIEAEYRDVADCVLRKAPLDDEIAGADYAAFKRLWNRALTEAMPHESPSRHDVGIRSPRVVLSPPRRPYGRFEAATKEQLEYYAAAEEMEAKRVNLLRGQGLSEAATPCGGTPKTDSGYDGRSDGESEWSGNCQSSLGTSSMRCGSDTLTASSASAAHTAQSADAVDSDTTTGTARGEQFIENNVAPARADRSQSTCSLGDSNAKFDIARAGEQRHTTAVSTCSGTGANVDNANGALASADAPAPLGRAQKKKRTRRRKKALDVGGRRLVYIRRFAVSVLLFVVLLYCWRSIACGLPSLRIDASYPDGPPPT